MSDTLQLMLKSLRTLPHVAKAHYTIAKKGAGIVPLEFTPIQMRILYLVWKLLEQRQMAHVVIVKPRQIFSTTVLNALEFKLSQDIPGLKTFITTHKAAITKEIRDSVKRFHNQMDEQLRINTIQNNDEVIEWTNLSKIGYGVAGEDSARGFPALILHPSEIGRYLARHVQDLIEGAMNAHASAEPGNMIFAESTSGGEGTYHHEIALKGWKNPNSTWFTLFFGAHEFPDYKLTPPKGFQPDTESIRLMEQYNLSIEQVYWRCVKLHEQMRGDVSAFQREFPYSFEEAFQSVEGRLIDVVVMYNSLESKTEVDDSQPLILGVDPAGSGDRTVLVYRRGYVITDYEVFNKMDAATLTEIIINRFEKRGVDHCFIDMGYGHGTYDLLVKRHHGMWVTGIHFGGSATNPLLYYDKRSEMAGDFKDWMCEGPDNMGGTARIPNKEEFVRDIRIIPKLEYLSNRRVFKLAAKEEIKDLLGFSPDIFDGSILTFGHPVLRKRSPLPTFGGQNQYGQSEMFVTNKMFDEFQQGEGFKQNPHFRYFNFPRTN